MTERGCSFRIEATLGPADLLRALEKVRGHLNQRRHDPSFEFDWLKRRVAFSANSREGLDECVRQFLAQMRKAGGGEGLFLPGRIEEKEGRFTQALGVTLQEPAVFAQLIGQALIEVGIHGVRVAETETGCILTVRGGGPLASQVDYRGLVREFPVPEYIRIVEE